MQSLLERPVYPFQAASDTRNATFTHKSLLHAMGFNCALAMIFLRFSFLHETVTYLTGVNTYVLYIFGPLAFLGALASGGVRRLYNERPGKFWFLFAAWILIAVPFSSWKGGSLAHVFDYLRTVLPMMIFTGGLATDWKDCRKMLYVTAAAAMVNLITAQLFVKTTSSDRLTLSWGATVANSNDLATHLLLVLPFLLFIAIRPGTWFLIRVVVAGALAVGLFQVLHTGSRGALVALGVTTLYVLVFGSGRQRVVVAVIAPISFAALLILLPSSTWNRLTSFSEKGDATGEAIESSEAREYLLKQSIIYTLEHPVFGVGPSQFSSFEGGSMTQQGLRGNWHETHNSYTEVSSECGIPALMLYLGGVISTFTVLAKIKTRALSSNRPEIVTAVFCLTVSLIAYCAATAFVNFAYHFYLPAMSGFVIAIWIVLQRESAQTDSVASTAQRQLGN